jgi:hypothetical protein
LSLLTLPGAASAYVSIRQHSSVFVSFKEMLETAKEGVGDLLCLSRGGRVFIQYCRHTSAYVSIRQHTSAYVS